MTNIEKAIKVLSRPKRVSDGIKYTSITTLACGSNLVEVSAESAIETALQALKKQMPMKFVSNSDDEQGYQLCPQCHNIICSNDDDNYFSVDKYCSECGQALDWGDTNV